MIHGLPKKSFMYPQIVIYSGKKLQSIIRIIKINAENPKCGFLDWYSICPTGLPCIFLPWSWYPEFLAWPGVAYCWVWCPSARWEDARHRSLLGGFLCLYHWFPSLWSSSAGFPAGCNISHPFLQSSRQSLHYRRAPPPLGRRWRPRTERGSESCSVSPHWSSAVLCSLSCPSEARCQSGHWKPARRCQTQRPGDQCS